MPETNSVKSTTKNPNKIAKTTARVLLGKALGFRDCESSTLDTLVDNGSLRTLGKGEILARRGEPYQALCLIVRGFIESSLMRQDGHRQLIGFLQAGDVAGLIGLIDGLGHVHDLRARDTDTTVLLIPAEILRKFKAHDVKLSAAFELQLAFRSRLLYERLSTDASIPVEARAARLILTLSGLYGVSQDNEVRLGIKLSQVDLADWLGVSRQRINSAMNQLKTDGAIKLNYSNITIVDKEKLVAFATL